MKRLMILLMVCFMVLEGCGSGGVSQEEYDKMKQSLIKMVSEDEDEKHLKRMLIIYTISREEA